MEVEEEPSADLIEDRPAGSMGAAKSTTCSLPDHLLLKHLLSLHQPWLCAIVLRTEGRKREMLEKKIGICELNALQYAIVGKASR